MSARYIQTVVVEVFDRAREPLGDRDGFRSSESLFEDHVGALLPRLEISPTCPRQHETESEPPLTHMVQMYSTPGATLSNAAR
jgi:hypothetical protein